MRFVSSAGRMPAEGLPAASRAEPNDQRWAVGLAACPGGWPAMILENYDSQE